MFLARLQKLRKVVYIRMEHLCSHSKDFHEIWFLSIIRKSVDQIRFINMCQEWVPYMETNIHIFTTTRSIILRMRNASHKKAQGIFNFLKNRTVYKTMSKNTVQPGRPQVTIWRMRTACCKYNATNTHSEYVILVSFPL